MFAPEGPDGPGVVDHFLKKDAEYVQLSKLEDWSLFWIDTFQNKIRNTYDASMVLVYLPLNSQ